jgi:hypothetical protein
VSIIASVALDLSLLSPLDDPSEPHVAIANISIAQMMTLIMCFEYMFTPWNLLF